MISRDCWQIAQWIEASNFSFWLPTTLISTILHSVYRYNIIIMDYCRVQKISSNLCKILWNKLSVKQIAVLKLHVSNYSATSKALLTWLYLFIVFNSLWTISSTINPAFQTRPWQSILPFHTLVRNYSFQVRDLG